MRDSTAARVNRLFDLLADSPEGLTWPEIAEAQDVSGTTARIDIRRLRLVFADDEINVVAVPQGQNEKHRYKLVGNYEDARGWIAGRILDMESRLETVEAVSGSIVNAVDGRTFEGRKARKVNRTITYLREELAEMDQ